MAIVTAAERDGIGTTLADVFEEHATVLEATRTTLAAGIGIAVDVLARSLVAGGKVLAFGNGGSAADAQHFASELVGRFDHDRPGWAAHALSTDGSALTSISNDFGFEWVFARQVEALARPGDVVVALSASGRSRNVIEGVLAARRSGCAVVSLSGPAPGELSDLSDVHLGVPSTTVARIQERHGLCLPAIVTCLEERSADIAGGRS